MWYSFSLHNLYPISVVLECAAPTYYKKCHPRIDDVDFDDSSLDDCFAEKSECDQSSNDGPSVEEEMANGDDSADESDLPLLQRWKNLKKTYINGFKTWN